MEFLLHDIFLLHAKNSKGGREGNSSYAKPDHGLGTIGMHSILRFGSPKEI